MMRAIYMLVVMLALTACVQAPARPEPAPPACAAPGEEQTDGGIGGTGLKTCPEKAAE